MRIVKKVEVSRREVSNVRVRLHPRTTVRVFTELILVQGDY